MMKKKYQKKNDIRRLYKDLAWTWPIISPPKDYIKESEKLKDIILTYSKIPVKTLLNLGCGGGHVDWVLKKYFEITGIDISRDMLRLAKKLNPHVTYLYGDMRKVRLKKHFDAVLIHDSINYIQTKKDLRSAFRTGFVHLKPGAVLITFAEEYGLIEQNKIRFSTHKKDNVEITFIEHYHDPDRRDTTFEGTFIYFIRKNKKLKIYTDRHLGGVFDLETWIKTLRNIGFAVKMLKQKIPEISQQQPIVTFVCRKPLRNRQRRKYRHYLLTSPG